MPSIPGISARTAVRALQKVGFRVVRQSGHVIMSDGKRRLTIPRKNPINAITMGNIARDAGLSPDEFRKLL
jgi:predicted RNA binding protein YcfA (HicA-like mRNA interferase family)